MNRALLVDRCNLHSRVLAARRGPTDQERKSNAALLHFLGHKYHLIKRGGDETTETNNVRIPINSSLEDRVAVHHDTQILNIVAVAPQHHGNDVLANVVYVALNSRKHQPTLRPRP